MTGIGLIRIGDLAKRAGVSVRTLRFYEEMGLILPEGHTGGGFRLYAVETIKHLQVIGSLKELGLTLNEVKQILVPRKSSGADRDTIHFLTSVFSEQLKLIDTKIDALGRARTEIVNALMILQSCEQCENEVLLDAIHCRSCARLVPRESVPDTLDILLR